MGCGCGKVALNRQFETAYTVKAVDLPVRIAKKTRDMAKFLAKAEQSTYIIYEFEGKIYYDRFECWKKDPRGKTRELVNADKQH